VVLVDSLPLIGGQMVHSLIGLFCGVFGNVSIRKSCEPVRVCAGRRNPTHR
jgi:hypothetical protein